MNQVFQVGVPSSER